MLYIPFKQWRVSGKSIQPVSCHMYSTFHNHTQNAGFCRRVGCRSIHETTQHFSQTDLPWMVQQQYGAHLFATMLNKRSLFLTGGSTMETSGTPSIPSQNSEVRRPSGC
mmetsp:Transcript_13773/g.32043  ORF Transcript_13773/g.32043 Transcript_13773/m.32043 type:complete len:109 (-) Transcript_13773:700-1026(-)